MLLGELRPQRPQQGFSTYSLTILLRSQRHRKMMFCYNYCTDISLYLCCSSEFRLPIHFRYQAPSPTSRYTTVVIPTPLVLLRHPVGSASLPCHPHTRDTCLWELLAPGRGEEETEVAPGRGEEETEVAPGWGEETELRAEIP